MSSEEKNETEETKKPRKVRILLYDRSPEKVTHVGLNINRTLAHLFRKEVKKEGYRMNLMVEDLMLQYLKSRGVMDGYSFQKALTGPQTRPAITAAKKRLRKIHHYAKKRRQKVIRERREWLNDTGGGIRNQWKDKGLRKNADSDPGKAWRELGKK